MLVFCISFDIHVYNEQELAHSLTQFDSEQSLSEGTEVISLRLTELVGRHT